MTIEKNKRSLVKNNPTCKDCEIGLIPMKNWKPSSAKRGDYLCRDCRNDRARVNYAKNPETSRIKAREHVRRWYKKNPEKYLALQLRKYNMTLQEYYDLVEDQNGVCKICYRFRPNKRAKRLCVDHDHQTGRIRGLLCDPCNRSLGVLGDTVEDFERILTYLKG